jgi:hypothetical protein
MLSGVFENLELFKTIRTTTTTLMIEILFKHIVVMPRMIAQ